VPFLRTRAGTMAAAMAVLVGARAQAQPATGLATWPAEPPPTEVPLPAMTSLQTPAQVSKYWLALRAGWIPRDSKRDVLVKNGQQLMDQSGSTFAGSGQHLGLSLGKDVRRWDTILMFSYDWQRSKLSEFFPEGATLGVHALSFSFRYQPKFFERLILTPEIGLGAELARISGSPNGNVAEFDMVIGFFVGYRLSSDLTLGFQPRIITRQPFFENGAASAPVPSRTDVAVPPNHGSVRLELEPALCLEIALDF
jgi:hypothetical protein